MTGKISSLAIFFILSAALLQQGEIDDRINCISVSNDGKVAIGGYKGAYLWDNGKIAWSVGINGVGSVAISERGYVAAGADAVYLIRMGEIVWRFGTVQEVEDVSISSDGKYIAAGSGGTAYLLDNSARIVWEKRYDGVVRRISISPDDEKVAVGVKGEIYVYHMNGSLIGSYTVGGSVGDLWIGDDSLLVSSTDGYIYWFTLGGKQWKKKMGSIQSMHASVRGFVVSTIEETGYYNQFAELVWPMERGIKSAAISRDGRMLAYSIDGRIKLFDLSPLLITTLSVQSNPQGCMVYVDGVLKGSTPANLSVDAGHHRVKVSCREYGDQEEEINISAGERKTLTFNFAGGGGGGGWVTYTPVYYTPTPTKVCGFELAAAIITIISLQLFRLVRR